MANLENQSNIAKQVAKEYFGNIIPDLDEILSELKFESTMSSSNFDYNTKTVYINLRYTHDINHFVHELFHAISTNYSDNGFQIGFNSKIFRNLSEKLLLETSYGYALNEGATHSFTRDATKGRFGEINPITSYNFCANIFKNLENHLGKDVMQILYSNFGVKDFINTISKEFHTSEENVLNLVLSMDAYFDAYRIYSVFLKDFESEDASSLLSNCYVYLSRIISDKLKSEGKKFDISNDISLEHLSNDEKMLYVNAIMKIDKKDLISKKSNVTVNQFEDLAMNLYTKENNNNLETFKNIPRELKTAEFYNYLLVNNYVCDENRIRKDFLKGDINASLTKKIFSENCNAFNIDKHLADNIRTMLSTRFVIRAGCEISDYYMKKCLDNKKFASYLKNSDSDYYNSLVNQNSNSKD